MTSNAFRSKHLIRYLQQLMLCLSVLAIGWLAWQHRSEVVYVLHNFPFYFLCLILLYAVGVCVQAASFSLMFPSVVRKSFVGLYDVWGRATLFGYVAPFFPSVLMRSFYFRRWGVGVKEYLVVTMRWALIGVYVAVIVAASAACSFYLKSTWWLLVFLPFALIGAYVYARFGEVITKIFSFRATVHDVNYGDVRSVIGRVLLVSMQYFIVALCYFIAFKMMKIELPFAVSVLLGVAIIIAALIPLFANGVGLVELCLGAVASGAGAGLGAVIAGLIYLRIAHALACLALIAGSAIIRNFNRRIEDWRYR